MVFSENGCVSGNNFVYLNKIFYNDQESSSPILTPIDTTGEEFTQQLTISSNACGGSVAVAAGNVRQGNCGCGCGCSSSAAVTNVVSQCDCCCDFVITADTTFDITNAYVIVHSFVLAEAAELAAEDVTVEGIPITTLTRNGNQYVGDLSGIMAEITRCACQSPCTNTCPGNFVMVTTDGPWELNATIVLEGTAYNSGPACQFKICYNTAEGTPLTVEGGASFAFCGVDIPCQISGISPSLVFDFDGCAKLLNPVITVASADGVCAPNLTGSLVVTPQLDLQVTRPSVFNLGACEVQMECDDLGQCNPCNPDHTDCIEPRDNCCCRF